MKMQSIKFINNEIVFGEKRILLDFPVKDAIVFNEKIFVLYDPDSYSEKFGQFNNLIAINVNGALIWKAALPTTDSGDRYYKVFISDKKLIAYSIFSFQCEIDINNGKIINQSFFK